MDMGTGIVALLTILVTWAFRVWDKKQKEQNDAEKKLAAAEKKEADSARTAVRAEYERVRKRPQ